jgi:conjugal transfer mating pair stabilization protein TraG
VANVPLGLAFFASTTSRIGAWLTETYETNFSLPDDELRFDRNGIMFGSRILEEMRRSTITDPTLAQDITSFVKNCLNPELLVNPGLMKNLIDEPDIWNFISTGATAGMFNPGLAVTSGHHLQGRAYG